MIFFDIETLQTNDESVIEELRSTIEPPAQYKKPESIDKWMAENAEDRLNELVAKTSLDGMYGRVACIAWAANDPDPPSTHHLANEAEAITEFYDYIENFSPHTDVFCGHNITGFDLPFLKHRSMILGIRPPSVLLNAMNAKPWDACIADTMLMWSTDRHKMTSMKKLCKAFGIEYVDDMDGSMVAETWETDPQKVIEYCKNDVRRTREIYKRMTFEI